MKVSLLYKSICGALGVAIFTGYGLNVIAQEQPIEQMTVTGSNIPQAISDAPRPITVIDALDIKLSGITNTADLLRGLAYNSFGSFRERSGSSFGQISTIDLRGIGSEYTAVLINGRRVPGSPLTGASIVDLNTIPIAAIESMEILKDSASAVYGADAVGGVINIILKKDYEGAELNAGLERPSLEGADSENFNFLFGKVFERGSIMGGFEFFKRDAISDGDRDYSRADFTGPDFGSTTGISVGGNTAFETDFSAPFVLGDCDTDIYAGVYTEPFGLDGEGCGFAFADVSLQTGNLERKSLFINSNYQLDDNAELYLDTRYTNNETSGRYAPAVGFFRFSEDSPFNTFGRDLDVFHRFVAHGNRSDSVDVDEITVNAGVRGVFENGIGYDIWTQYFDYSGDELGNTYVQTSVLEAEVAAGNYNAADPFSQDLNHLAAIERSGIELTRDLKTTNTSFGATINGEAFEMEGGTTGWAFGFEFATEDYRDIYDDFREAVDVLGSAGNSAEGSRQRYAYFGEFRLPVLEKLEINLAARYDDYSDFGEEFSPQIAIRYTPTDFLTLRTSFGEGFKAPDLIELHQEPAESNDDLQDLYRCGLQGIAIADCPTFQVTNFGGGNEALEAEESESFNFGAVLDWDEISVSLDYYDVELNNQVTQLSLEQVNSREAEGILPEGVVVNRGPTVDGVPGAVFSISRPLSNGASLKTSGLDLGLNYNTDTVAGNLDVNVSYVHILRYDQKTSEDTPFDRLAGGSDGNSGFPEDRVTTSIRLNQDKLTYSFNTSYISGFDNTAGTGDYSSWVGHDFTVNYVDAFGADGLSFTAGVLNLTEEDPSIDSEAGYSQSIVLNLYSVSGRVPFLSVGYKFL